MIITERRIFEAALRLFAERGSSDVTMSELAASAGFARGTLYRNVESVDQLFGQVRDALVTDLHATLARVMDEDGEVDPPLRLATGLRFIIRLAHQNPAAGRFILRFALTDESLREMLTGPPMRDIREGVKSGRYNFREGTESKVASMVIGTALSAIWTVLEGHETWRDAGTAAAELVLRALGVDSATAYELATHPLPDLPFTMSDPHADVR